MRSLDRVLLAAVASLGLTTMAEAKVKISIDLDKQTMHVEANARSFDWKVSSGKFGYETPAGDYHVLWMDKDHFSDTYDKAPMPNAIFFAPGYAIHGATKSAFGHPASHGCVRLPVAKSAMLFDMVKKQGADITLTGGAEASATVAEKLRHRGEEDVPPPVDASTAGYPGGPDDGYVPAPGPQSGPMSGYSPVYGQVY